MSQFNQTTSEDKWVEIQQKTFTNWVNEQLTISGRSVKDISTDFCDGVNLVALVEALQLKKIGKICTSPTNRIQKLQNVSLACKAIIEDNIKLVNIGNEDIVNGNSKLILGLIWHLVMRYQISSRKSKLPPKKLMINWLQMNMVDLDMKNFTSDWNDGIALHALLDYLKPGLSPKWRELHSKDRIENCRTAMVLAKDHFNIPRVITPEDFASPALDELSAMTYLSYFLKVDSPGYYDTLNWVCKQLRTTLITNLTTDWNDGYNLCAVVQAVGGEIENWPNIDRNNAIENLQKAIDEGKKLGVEPLLTAEEMADPKVDHLGIMTYLSRFQHIVPKKSDSEKLVLKYDFENLLTGVQASFRLDIADKDVKKDLLQIDVQNVVRKPDCDVTWREKYVECKFTPREIGRHELKILYNNVLLSNCPVIFTVKRDVSKVRLMTLSSLCKVGSKNQIKVSIKEFHENLIAMETRSPSGEVRPITDLTYENEIYEGVFQPKSVGLWKVHVYCQEEEMTGSPITFETFDPQKAWISGPHNGVVGQSVTFTVDFSSAGSGEIEADARHSGESVSSSVVKSDDSTESNVRLVQFTPEKSGMFFVYAKLNGHEIAGSGNSVTILDPGQILVTGEGISRGIRGKECQFQVNSGDLGGNIKVTVENNGENIETSWEDMTSSTSQFTYTPPRAGIYNIKITWNDMNVTGSPFHAKVTDRSRVTLTDDLTDRKDENGFLALDYGAETCLHYDIGSAGPGSFNAEVLGPDGKLQIDIRTPNKEEVEVAFTAKEEGDHYIHLYWSNVPLDSSPIMAYCPGPILPVDHTKVQITGKGRDEGRALVPTEFMIDGKKAGPGVPKVLIKGVKRDPTVDMKAMKYDRYKCSYCTESPGGYLLYVYWSDELVPGCPFKISVSNRGDSDKVKVSGQGLKGGFVGQELRIVVDASEAGYGEILTHCKGYLYDTRCDTYDQKNGIYTLRLYPTEPSSQTLTIKYDQEHIPGSPFNIPVGEPPDPKKVRVYGPGVENGLLQTFESKFLVETMGAGSGQLSVRIRGPKGAFKVDMARETEDDRTVVCRYDPEEPGLYIINIKWSGRHVNGSPFQVHISEAKDELIKLSKNEENVTTNGNSNVDLQWREEI